MSTGVISATSKLTITKYEERVVATACGRVTESEAAIRRRKALMRVDRELEKGNFKAALSLVKHLQGKPGDGGLRGFGVAGARKVARNAPSLHEIKLHGDKEPSILQSKIDLILHSVKFSRRFQLLEKETEEVLIHKFGEVEDCGSSNSLFDDHLMCIQHEAGHFLVGYMFGVLPKRYEIPSMEDLLQDEFASGKVEFIGFESLIDVTEAIMLTKKFTRGKLNNKQTLKRFLRVLLGGLVAEHLSFGYSELLHSDVQKLDRVLTGQCFTENEIDSEVRQAVEDTILILCSHSEARSRLAKAMALGRSVGSCIDTIENALTFENK